jgi:hypothetical protein
VEFLEKVSINLWISLVGILNFVSFCIVGIWMGPLAHVVIVIVGRSVHPCWVKAIFSMSY